MRLPSPALLACMPGSTVTVETTDAHRLYSLARQPEDAATGATVPTPPREKRTLTLPCTPGIHRLDLAAGDGASTIPLRLLLCVPIEADFSRKTWGAATIEGTALGTYLDPLRSGIDKVRTHPDAYRPPRYFLPLVPETAACWISPSLRVMDLVVPTKETGERHVQWAPPSYRLLLAIERFRRALDEAHIPSTGLRFLSLFRTPSYNRRLRSSRFSRHAYADAFDFVIDNDNDGRMDDLTGDGKADRDDALRLVLLIEDLQADGEIPVGGIGVYTFAGGDHTVTLHLDLRGHRARWAYHHDARGRRREFTWTSRRFARQDEAERLERLRKKTR